MKRRATFLGRPRQELASTVQVLLQSSRLKFGQDRPLRDVLAAVHQKLRLKINLNTGKRKGRKRNGEEPIRPTDPSLRCLAFEVHDLRRRAAAVGLRETMEAEATPTEIR